MNSDTTVSPSSEPGLSIELLQRALQDAGYKAAIKSSDGRSFIDSAASGMRFSVFIYGRDMVQFTLLMNNDVDLTIDDCNSFCKSFRLSKLYLSSSSLAVLDFDWIFPDGQIVSDIVRRHLESWEVSISSFVSLLREKHGSRE